MSRPDIIPPKPASRAEKTSLLRQFLLFRKDIFTSQPAKLYRAWMAEFRTPFFRSYMVNQPELIKQVLNERPDDFPKSSVIRESLAPLLGNSVFVTNGAVWKRQRRIIDPAFEGGRLRDAFSAMVEAGEQAVGRIYQCPEGEAVEIEAQMSHLTADVIFRTLFSIPIEHEVAAEVFAEFRTYQRSQPLINLGNFVRLPNWVPRLQSKSSKRASKIIRDRLAALTADRAAEIEAGSAPDDLATKIMTNVDPETCATFSTHEMVDQVAIFFLAGHETSASALGWALHVLALDQATQEAVAAEVQAGWGDNAPTFASLSKLGFTRDVFREVLRLYPPVPMMVRTNLKAEEFRGRAVKIGSQIVLSPWHLHRHERLWDRPDVFDPHRWKTDEGKASQRAAYLPFSSGPRVCTGAGFAMLEGVLLLAMLVRAFRFEVVEGNTPVPVAHLTVRAKDGIYLKLIPRDPDSASKHKA